MARIDLGDKVKDPITGLVGIAIGRVTWINGCDRIVVQPEGMKDGKPYDNYNVDEPQLVVITRHKIKPGPRDTGGPLAPISPRASVSRD